MKRVIGPVILQVVLAAVAAQWLQQGKGTGAPGVSGAPLRRTRRDGPRGLIGERRMAFSR